MITDDELENLPEDPELAFVQYEASLRKRIQYAIARGDGEEGSAQELHFEYMSHVLGMVNAFDLEALKGWSMPSADESWEIIQGTYRQLMADVDFNNIQIRIKNARRKKVYSVALDHSAKQKIRHHLGQIKEVVDKLEVSESKKEALYSKIGALEDEVNRDRTRFDAAMALVLEVGDTAGEFGKLLKPIKEFMDSITGVIKAAKGDEEQRYPSLAAPETPKQIESPKKQLPSPENNNGSGDLDDEIPF
jgi:hypothetical protein